MRGSMVSCSLCSRKLHMFAVRSGKPSCACLQQKTKLCMFAAENQAVHVCSGKAMQINDGRTEDMDQEVA